ncbi:ATP synthase f chain, mitochondrial precursor [Parahypoxylon ruwenzoriense]
MSFVTRRALSTLIPPKVASPNAVAGAREAVRLKRVINFYEKIPRGPAPEIKPTGFLGKYQAKHFGKNPSAKPIIHAIVLLLVIGYPMNYYFHLRHHKNNAH